MCRALGDDLARSLPGKKSPTVSSSKASGACNASPAYQAAVVSSGGRAESHREAARRKLGVAGKAGKPGDAASPRPQGVRRTVRSTVAHFDWVPPPPGGPLTQVTRANNPLGGTDPSSRTEIRRQFYLARPKQVLRRRPNVGAGTDGRRPFDFRPRVWTVAQSDRSTRFARQSAVLMSSK
uniref:Uncharacterized protein n=1 Tax=Trichuris muris TaxID=70415 RepID=A0A5S6Q941_TRIMR